MPYQVIDAHRFGSLPARDASKPAYTEQRQVHFPEARELKTFGFQSRDAKGYAVVYWPTTDFSQPHWKMATITP